LKPAAPAAAHKAGDKPRREKDMRGNNQSGVATEKFSAHTADFAPTCLPCGNAAFSAAAKVLLRFFSVSAAPAFASDLFACKQGATACCVTGFGLVQSAANAVLAGCKFRELGFVDLAGIGLVTQTRRSGIGLGQHSWSSKYRTCKQSTCAQTELGYEFTTI
jgi:hypothetical protein